MIYICKETKLDRFLEKYILDYINKKGTKIIGIDFEFNRVNNIREIALCQINFTLNSQSDIFLFYPPYIKKNIFVKLLTSDIIKILHGSESLDIPYLLDNILSIDDRQAFFKNLFDTRYMCEYYNIDNNINGKCKIYDLLLALKVIDKKKYNELYENDKLIGNIWNVFIDVKKLSKEVAKYSAYDVIYLPDLYKVFMNIGKTNIYNKIIPDISCVSFNLRYNNKINEISEILSKYNLNKINFYENNMTYNDLYIIIFEWIKINDNVINNLYNINYFKKIIELFVKNIIYNKINNNNILEIKNFNFKNNYLYVTINNILNEL